jgi:hypothetical protein
MNKLEAPIERRVVKWAKAQGCIVCKLQGQGNKGYPDRLFILPNGKTAFIEFKRPNEVPEPLQAVRIRELKALGHNCEVFDNDTRAITWLSAYLSVGATDLSDTSI